MNDYANIILERPDGAHRLAFGEYVFEKTETANILYIGIGDFGQGEGGSGGGIVPSGTLEITQNGTYNIRLYKNVNVNVPQETFLPALPLEFQQNITESYEANTDIQTSEVHTNIVESYNADITLVT